MPGGAGHPRLSGNVEFDAQVVDARENAGMTAQLICSHRNHEAV